MMNPNEDELPDVLEQATEALRDAPIPDTVPPRIIASTVQAIQTLTDQNHFQPLLPWRTIMSLRNLVAAVAVLTVAFLVVVWPVPKSSILAFAEVQGQVETTKSVQYTETRHDKTPDNKSGPKTQKRVMILGRYLKREDCKVLTAGDKLDGQRDWGQHAAQHDVVIFDLQAGNLLHLCPESKLFSLNQTTLSISPKDNSINSEKVKPMPEVDFYEQLRGLPSDKAEKVPDCTIDGKRSLGYRFVEKDEEEFGTEHFTQTFTRDIWVDPGTKLPVRIEVTFRSANPMMGQSDWVLSDFIWDAPLDRSLFSTTPPEGYKKAN